MIENGQFLDAEELVAESLQRFRGDAGAVGAWAELAARRGDLTEALVRWEQMRIRFPDSDTSYRQPAVALRGVGRFAEAEALLQEGMQRLPDQASLFIEHAWIAHIRRDWLEARQRWLVVRERFPGHGHVPTAIVLRELGEYAAADELLEEAITLGPSDTVPYIEHASVAQARKDWPVAVSRWARLRLRFPDQSVGFTGGAAALREMRRFDEAEAVLQAAAEQFPEDPAPPIDLAFLSHVRRDLPEALVRWQTVRERFPQQIKGYTFAALDLKYLGRFEEADRLLEEAMERFPESPRPWIDGARMSQERQDWPEAFRRWEQVRTRFPDEIDAYLWGAVAARHCGEPEAAEALLQTAKSIFPQEVSPALDHARMAHDRRDWPEAVGRWEVFRSRFPERPEGYLGGAEALRAMQHVESADALLAEAEEKLPTVAKIAVERAWLPFHRHEWPEAARRFAAIRTRFADDKAGYLGGAAVLTSQGLLEDAERLLESGMAELPAEPTIALDHAQVPIAAFLRDRRDWAEAIRRLERLCACFPDFETGHLVAVRVLRDAERFDEAEALVADAKRRMPKSSGLAIEHARMALAQSDWEEAVNRFAQVKDCFLDCVESYVGLAEALSRLSRFDEAEVVLGSAMLRFPMNLEPFREHAQLASRRNELQVAFDRWIDAERRFPNNAQVSQGVFEAQLRLSELDSAAGLPTTHPTALLMTDGVAESPRKMILEFESLGGTLLGCEFGLVQRALGAEPLGLLRWSDMSADDIVNALEARFDGVGLPENTELLIPEKDGRAEYATRDRRFGMRMHTFVARDDAPADRLFTQLCRRLQYLRDKLVADLSANAKIFVFKITARDLTQSELDRLVAAMRLYGENTLLYVRYADAEHPNGTVEVAAYGLIIGYIDHFAMGKDGGTLGPATLSWTVICGKAYRLWQVGATANPQSPGFPVSVSNALPASLEEPRAESANAMAPTAAISGAKVAMEAAAAAAASGNIAAAHAAWLEARLAKDAPFQAWTLAAEHPGTGDPVALLEEALALFPEEAKVVHDLARAKEAVKDWPAAELCWRRYVARGGDQWWAYAALAAALRAQDRDGEADGVLRDGIVRLPHEPLMVAETARAAENRGDWPVAFIIWDDIIARFPDRWIGYRGKAGTLRQSGQTHEADQLIDLHAPSFSDDLDAQHDLARFAERVQDWKRAEMAWRLFIALEPRRIWAYLALACTLREQSRYLEAEDVLRDVRQRFPNDIDGLIEAAHCAELRGDPAEAAHQWQAVSALRSHSSCGPLGEAAMLRRQGQIEAADEVILAAIKRLPDEPSLLEAYGLNAMARNVWAEALTRLQTAQRRFPSNDALRQRIFEVRLKIADEGGSAPPIEPEDKGDAEDRALVMQFESLGGGGHGCEFGIFQRHFGAEPLGLLRWADVYQDQLSQALETEFAGIGDPEFTNLFVPGNAATPEYWTTDTRYHMAMRSFVPVAEVPLDRMRQQVTKRFKYLSRKLVEDLKSGTKIFVYKNMKRNLTEAELRRLHAACRRYGENTLLYVRYEDARHPCGTVVAEGDGLLVGYIGHFSHTPDTDEFLGTATDALLRICRNAYGLWERNIQSQRTAA